MNRILVAITYSTLSLLLLLLLSLLSLLLLLLLSLLLLLLLLISFIIYYYLFQVQVGGVDPEGDFFSSPLPGGAAGSAPGLE